VGTVHAKKRTESADFFLALKADDVGVSVMGFAKLGNALKIIAFNSYFA